GSIAGMAAYPFVTSIMGVILIVLLFIDINKLHLLWVYPIIAMTFEFTVGKRSVKRALKEINKK
ncbi:hypothetical protein KKG58_01120, partial [Patescibacteria group bacterium]|nr:hypothetical protein [Patescibacteria group bacterium]